jgi:hypothetical protein
MPKGSVGTDPGVWRTEAGITAICLDKNQHQVDKEAHRKITREDREVNR